MLAHVYGHLQQTERADPTTISTGTVQSISKVEQGCVQSLFLLMNATFF